MLDLVLSAWPLALVALVVLAALWVARWFGAEKPFPYERRGPLLTKAEAAFFRVLRVAAAEWTLFSMVRLGDVIRVRGDAAKKLPWMNRINSKHLDFVLCDNHSFDVRLAIELDDASHQRPDRQERDRFVEQALAAAGVALLRVPVSNKYDAEALRAAILEKVG